MRIMNFTRRVLSCVLFAACVMTANAVERLMVVGDGVWGGWLISNSIVMFNTAEQPDVWKATVNLKADAGILARQHLFVLASLVFWIVLGVGVERSEHGAYGSAHSFVGVERVHIHKVEVTVYGVEHVEVLGNTEVVVAGVLR